MQRAFSRKPGEEAASCAREGEKAAPGLPESPREPQGRPHRRSIEAGATAGPRQGEVVEEAVAEGAEGEGRDV